MPDALARARARSTSTPRIPRSPGLGMLPLLVVLLAVGAAPSARGQGDCPPDWSPAFPYDTDLYPFTNRCLELPLGTIHYIDEQPAGEARATALLLHGNPSWSFIYRDIARDLLDAGFRIVAPDYYGFGLSDKPTTGEFGYTPADHADVMEQFVLALDLDGLTLVVQDWGGAVGAGLADRLPERFDALVVMNTLLQPLDPEMPGYRHWATDYGLDNIAREDFYRRTGTLPRGTGVRLGRLAGPVDSPEYLAVRNAYWGPFLDLETGEPLSDDVVAPSNIIAQNLVLSADYLATVDDAIRNRLNDRPAFLLYGAVDPFFGGLRCDENREPTCAIADTACTDLPEGAFCLDLEDGEPVYPYVDFFRDRWGTDTLYGEWTAPEGGHFVQEYRPAEIAGAVRTVTAIAQGSGLRLAAPDFAAAGERITIAVENAEPGEVVRFGYATERGVTAVPGCPDLVVSLEAPILLGAVAADADGRAALTRSVPGAGAGLEVIVQAVQVGGCRLSNLDRIAIAP